MALILLRSVLTFVSTETFCARKAWLNNHAHTRIGIGIDVVNYATKYIVRD